MSFDIKLYEYSFGNDYEDGDAHKSLSDFTNFDVQVLSYSTTLMNAIENYTFKVPNNNGLLWKGMSYNEGEIGVEYLITLGSDTSIEQNVSDFINDYLGYYSGINSTNKFDRKLVLVNSDDYSNTGRVVVLSNVSNTTLGMRQAVVTATFTILEAQTISRQMYIDSNTVNAGGVIALDPTYLSNLNTPPYITIVFNATCTNPVLTSTDGTYIRLVEDFKTNDVVIINCEDKTITFNGANGLYALDFGSTFFNLNTWQDTIDFTTDSGGAGTSITVNWYNRWLA
jgi:phage-related protein